MDLITILFLGILPAGLLMWAGNVIRAQVADEKAGKDWLWFLAVGLGLSVIAFILAISIGDRTSNFTMPVLLPITFGFAAALEVHLFQSHNINVGKLALIFLLIAVMLSLGSFANSWTILLLFFLIATLTALAWLIWGQNGRQYLLLFTIEVVLLLVSIRVTDMSRISDMTPHWLASSLSVISYLFIPWAGIVLSALLIRRLFVSELPPTWREVALTLIMVAILFSMVGYQAMLTSLWDVATDGLGWVLLLMTSSTIGIGSAMLMTWSIPRKRLWASILFAFTVPLILAQAHNVANYDKDHTWGTKPIITTEYRAEKIDKAIQHYYEKNNEYPQALSELTPWYLLYIPNPVIIPGQDWCYEGGIDHYRLGYVYREFFSMPASVRVHSFAGEPSTSNWGCEEEAAPYSKPLGF